jgi:hypothetical protein
MLISVAGMEAYNSRLAEYSAKLQRDQQGCWCFFTGDVKVRAKIAGSTQLSIIAANLLTYIKFADNDQAHTGMTRHDVALTSVNTRNGSQVIGKPTVKNVLPAAVQALQALESREDFQLMLQSRKGAFRQLYMELKDHLIAACNDALAKGEASGMNVMQLLSLRQFVNAAAGFNPLRVMADPSTPLVTR